MEQAIRYVPAARLSHRSSCFRGTRQSGKADRAVRLLRWERAWTRTQTDGTYGSTLQEPKGPMLLLGLIWVSLVLLGMATWVVVQRVVVGPRDLVVAWAHGPDGVCAAWAHGMLHSTAPPPRPTSGAWSSDAVLVPWLFRVPPDRTGLSRLFACRPSALEAGPNGSPSVVHVRLAASAC